MLVMLSQAWESGPLFLFLWELCWHEPFYLYGKILSPLVSVTAVPWIHAHSYLHPPLHQSFSPALTKIRSMAKGNRPLPICCLFWSSAPLLHPFFCIFQVSFSMELLSNTWTAHNNTDISTHSRGGLLFQCQVPRGTTLCFVLSFLL
jgi:hypothetical protein